MKLLFKTEIEDSEELKELLGFIDVDIKIKNLIPDLRTATNDVIDLIGAEIYQKAVELYNEGEISPENKEFIYSVRYPIAINAYRLLAPSNDIAHTNNGRKMRTDSNEKLPFEWMIDRDNQALEKRYYRALDDLIKFLDRQPPGELLELWKSSTAFKSSHDLFVRTVDEFDKVFVIQSRLLLIKLSTGLEDCEQYDIRPIIGSQKFNSLKEKVKSSAAITDEKDLLLLKLIRKATVFSALAWAMTRFSIQLLPEGILQHYTSDRETTQSKKPALKSEPIAAQQAFESDKAKVLREIQDLVRPEPIAQPQNDVMPGLNYGDKYFST